MTRAQDGGHAPEKPDQTRHAAAGLTWTLYIPWKSWVGQLLGSGRPLPPPAQLAALAGDNLWAVGVTLAITLPPLLLPNGRLRSPRFLRDHRPDSRTRPSG